MGKIVSRNVVSQSKEDLGDRTAGFVVNYCLCGEFLLVLEGSIEALPRRPVDNCYALRNEGEGKREYKLNAVGGTGVEAGGILLRREGTYEYQRRLHCPRCQLCVGYETVPGDGKGPATFLLPGGMTESQGKVPKDAFEGEEAARVTAA